MHQQKEIPISCNNYIYLHFNMCVHECSSLSYEQFAALLSITFRVTAYKD